MMAKRYFALAARAPGTYRRTVQTKRGSKQLVFEPGPGKAGVPLELTADEINGIAMELNIGRIIEVDESGKPLPIEAAAEPEPATDEPAQPVRSGPSD